jgi:hypothetical protein
MMNTTTTTMVSGTHLFRCSITDYHEQFDLDIDDESITSVDDDSNNDDNDESTYVSIDASNDQRQTTDDTERRKADALKQQIGRLT